MTKCYVTSTSPAACLAAGGWDWQPEEMRSTFWAPRFDLRVSEELCVTVFFFIPDLEKVVKKLAARETKSKAKAKGQARSPSSVLQFLRVAATVLIQVGQGGEYGNLERIA